LSTSDSGVARYCGGGGLGVSEPSISGNSVLVVRISDC